MKVVLFCGGLGTRLRDYEENVPKPMVSIGYRPIMWHLMRYYAHFGHKDFILCLGYKADVIKKYFIEYDECLSNDFIMTGGKDVSLLSTDIHDWRITFVDTGAASPIGERLRRVREYVQDEEMFMANYTDCLTDMDLNAYVEHFVASDCVAGMVTVPPNVSFHYVTAEEGRIASLTDVRSTDLRVNGGFFLFRPGIFDVLRPDEDLVAEPFHRLIDRKQLLAYEYGGFWKAMDTFKDKQVLDELQESGARPWEVWQTDTRTHG